MTNEDARLVPASSLPERIGSRFRVCEQIGRGGTGVVYRVIDESSARELALKTIALAPDDRLYPTAAAMLEREYHVLAQLSHPNAIEVYEYGVVANRPYYTMELLAGSDLRDRAPLAWRTASAYAYDVASCLALLHSRRIVHRDVTPRNVRCIADDHAKLMDFGTMIPVGFGGPPMGTPAFMAPEVAQRAVLDARTDLFSLGATLYYALTGKPPCPVDGEGARTIAAPSTLVADIPNELDTLVLGLLALEPSMRPRTAFEVLHRLNAIANLQRVESNSVVRAYLTTPRFVGRAAELSRFRERVAQALRAKTGFSVLVQATAGRGRSRFLNQCTLEAQTLGLTVLRANASAVREAGSIASGLAEQVVELMPALAREAPRGEGAVGELLDAPERIAPRPQQIALARWLLDVSRQCPMAIAVDDIDRMDEASAALLATLADGAEAQLVVVIATSEPLGQQSAPALRVFAESSTTLELMPLDAMQTAELLGSVFGDVPGLAPLSERAHTLTSGSPRECMDLAQHLVDRGVVRYAGGSWTLPARLGPENLPQSIQDVLRARVHSLGALARELAQAHALSTQRTLSREEYALLIAPEQVGDLQDALLELVRHEVLVNDGLVYAIVHPAQRAALIAELTAPQKRTHHAALATLCERSARPGLALAYHALCAGQNARAQDSLQATLRDVNSGTSLLAAAQLTSAELAFTLERAVEVAKLECSRRAYYEVLRWAVLSSIALGDQLCLHYLPELQERLRVDSGWYEYQELAAEADLTARLTAALARAHARYQATPAAARVYSVEEAIRCLGQLAGVWITIGARTLDAPLLLQLPPLLEPFAPLSPLLHALWQNAIATCDATCFRKTEHALARWKSVYAQLEPLADSVVTKVADSQNAIAYALGLNAARLGMRVASVWLEILDTPSGLLRVNASYLRKIICLQNGDFEGAERCSRQAELIGAQMDIHPAFTNTLTVELVAHAAGLDLIGVQHVRDRILPLAERYAGWRVFRDLADGYFHQLCGDLERALGCFERAASMSSPEPSDPTRGILGYAAAAAGCIQVLLDLGRPEEARTAGERALARCPSRATEHDVARPLALAEATLGDFERAEQRIASVIDEQLALEIEGLNLGISYETRARIAIWAGDADAVERYASLAAREFRYGAGSSLGTRYERLLHEARAAQVGELPPLVALEASTVVARR